MCMMNKSMRAINIIRQCARAPIRALGRACDFYVKSMAGCAGRMPHGPIFGVSGGVFSPMPDGRNHGFYRSVVADDDDDSDNDDYYRKLIWAASNRSSGPGPARPIGRNTAPPMERIDEDEACEFAGDADSGLGPQSRHCTVAA